MNFCKCDHLIHQIFNKNQYTKYLDAATLYNSMLVFKLQSSIKKLLLDFALVVTKSLSNGLALIL